MSNHNFQSGAVFDPRSAEERANNYQFTETVANAFPVVWEEKNPINWRRFPIFNQNGSGSCVAQTQAKELGIMRFLKDGTYVHFSATDIYQKRNNKPDAGMWAVDARKIATQGVTLEVLTPSENMTDSEMDAVVIEDYKHQVGSVFSVSNYLEDPVGDIETIASIIQSTGKGVMTWFYFEIAEWTSQPTIINPNLKVDAPNTLRHSVCAVDFTLYQGKKALIIEDSWGTSFGMAGQRVITEDFFKKRNWYAGHLVNFKFEVGGTKPSYDGTTIISLQKCLRYEGFFPTNIDFVENYGPITKKGVIEFQKKYGIDPIGVVGPLTKAKLKQLFP